MLDLAVKVQAQVSCDVSIRIAADAIEAAEAHIKLYARWNAPVTAPDCAIWVETKGQQPRHLRLITLCTAQVVCYANVCSA